MCTLCPKSWQVSVEVGLLQLLQLVVAVLGSAALVPHAMDHSYHGEAELNVVAAAVGWRIVVNAGVTIGVLFHPVVLGVSVAIVQVVGQVVEAWYH